MKPLARGWIDLAKGDAEAAQVNANTTLKIMLHEESPVVGKNDTIAAAHRLKAAAYKREAQTTHDPAKKDRLSDLAARELKLYELTNPKGTVDIPLNVESLEKAH